MHNLKVAKTHGVTDEDTIINTGAASISTNQPAILVKEQQSNSTNQEPKSKELLFHLIGHVNGVSVHYLRTILLQEVRDAVLDEVTTTIYEDVEERLNHSFFQGCSAKISTNLDSDLKSAGEDLSSVTKGNKDDDEN